MNRTHLFLYSLWLRHTSWLIHSSWLSRIACIGLLGFSHSSYAHVRWFIPDGTNPDVRLPFDTIALVLTITTLSLFVFATLFSRVPILPRPLKVGLTQTVITSHPWMWYFLVLIINCYLAVNLLQGEFLAPNLYLSPQFALYGVIIQAAAIVVMAVSVSLTGIAIVLTSLALLLFFPIFIALDYLFEFLFVGLSLFFIGPSLNRNDYQLCKSWGQDKNQWRKIAVNLIRIGLGLQLLELGVHNKLMLPGMALAFINQNEYYNFFPLLNLPQVSNLHFVLFVGISETIIGLLLIANLANRIIYGLLLAIFTTTFLLSGIEELVGHMPIFTIIFILFLEAGKQTDSTTNTPQNTQT
ncbi:hypothetical protein MD588_21710 [Photobacterium sp. SDRW27]|uniref:hypothetical protein n=1 Tax=Photobacterium obscurum TaxID=2829490 RepID=UPI00224429B1|nr:hypothetical protein [Photobacterium obscurum]MCW8331414.1 hypothetical protein [Photobacterium obscurum]